MLVETVKDERVVRKEWAVERETESVTSALGCGSKTVVVGGRVEVVLLLGADAVNELAVEKTAGDKHLGVNSIGMSTVSREERVEKGLAVG